MEDLNTLLIEKPSVHVVAETVFNMEGLDEWIDANGYRGSDDYNGSPLQRIREGAAAVEPGQSEAEILSEFAGRFCYNSFMKGRPSDEYIQNVVEMRHGSVLEHVNFSFAISGVSRALTHELIRHRVGFAISQESQRYVDAKDIRFVIPPLLLFQCGGDLNHPRIQAFAARCESALAAYKAEKEAYQEELESATDVKAKTVIKKRMNEAARALLPNAAETKLTWTGNVRGLRHVCELRGDEHADLEIRRLAVALAEIMMEKAPYAFFDVQTVEGDFGVGVVQVQHTKV